MARRETWEGPIRATTQRTQFQATCRRRRKWREGARKGLSLALALALAWEGAFHTHLFYCIQHGPPSIPWLGGLAYAVEACHAVPLPVLQLPVEGVGQHQNTVIQVEVGYLQRQRW